MFRGLRLRGVVTGEVYGDNGEVSVRVAVGWTGRAVLKMRGEPVVEGGEDLC